MPPPSPAIALPRLRSLPPADPPYDDEHGSGVPPMTPPPAQGAPALAYETPEGTSHETPHVTCHETPHVTAPGSRPGPRRPASVRGAPGSPPDGRRLRGLGQAMAEILAGRRPPGTVADRLTDRAYAELVRAGKMINTRRPPLAGPPHVNRPRDGAIEACLLVHCGERSHMLAIRLERRGVQWLCTDFETA